MLTTNFKVLAVSAIVQARIVQKGLLFLTMRLNRIIEVAKILSTALLKDYPCFNLTKKGLSSDSTGNAPFDSGLESSFCHFSLIHGLKLALYDELRALCVR